MADAFLRTRTIRYVIFSIRYVQYAYFIPEGDVRSLLGSRTLIKVYILTYLLTYLFRFTALASSPPENQVQAGCDSL